MLFVNLAEESHFQIVPNLAPQASGLAQASQASQGAAARHSQGHPQVVCRELLPLFLAGGEGQEDDGESGQEDGHEDRSQEAEVGPPLLRSLLHVLEVVDAQEEEAGEDRQEAAVETLGDLDDALAINCKSWHIIR